MVTLRDGWPDKANRRAYDWRTRALAAEARDKYNKRQMKELRERIQMLEAAVAALEKLVTKAVVQ